MFLRVSFPKFKDPLNSETSLTRRKTPLWEKEELDAFLMIEPDQLKKGASGTRTGVRNSDKGRTHGIRSVDAGR